MSLNHEYLQLLNITYWQERLPNFQLLTLLSKNELSGLLLIDVILNEEYEPLTRQIVSAMGLTLGTVISGELSLKPVGSLFITMSQLPLPVTYEHFMNSATNTVSLPSLGHVLKTPILKKEIWYKIKKIRLIS